MPEPLHLACAVEGRYVPHTAAMLHSVLTHSRSLEVRINLLHGGDVSADEAGRLTRMVDALGGSIVFHEVPDERVEGLPTKGFTGKATWYRIFLPELVPDVDRVLYLDADLIATDELAPLWATELGDAYVGAVTNVFAPYHSHHVGEIGLAGEDVYFNAGVLLLNLEAMRRDECPARLLECGLSRGIELAWRDQDALNVVLGERRVPLHPRWNCMNAILTFPWAADVFGAAVVEDARRNPGIRHFEGPSLNKPWHYLAGDEARELYMRHRRQTPWPKLRPEGVTPRNVVRKLARRRG